MDSNFISALLAMELLFAFSSYLTLGLSIAYRKSLSGLDEKDFGLEMASAPKIYRMTFRYMSKNLFLWAWATPAESAHYIRYFSYLIAAPAIVSQVILVVMLVVHRFDVSVYSPTEFIVFVIVASANTFVLQHALFPKLLSHE